MRKIGAVYFFIFGILLVNLIFVVAVGFDLNNDGVTDYNDLQVLALNYHSKAAYNASYDFNGDLKVDLFDLVAVARNFNSTNSSGGGSLNNLTNECANPDPSWIWCDDFEQNRLSSYFEYDSANGDFSRASGVGVNGSYGMKVIYRPGQQNSGNLKLAFGRTPDSYIAPVDSGTNDYRDIYWRAYTMNEPTWTGGEQNKFSRAIVFALADWSEAAIVHVWGMNTDHIGLDPASGTDTAGNLQASGYNDVANFRWLTANDSITPIYDSSHVGKWYCIEARMRLNDAGQSNGEADLWIDGQLEAQRAGMNLVGSYNAYGINAILFENYWNNGASPKVEERYWDNIVVGTQRIGC